jgi:multiple sugar transport system permease protein
MVMILFAIVYLVPVLWLLSASLKSPSEVLGYPPQWLPKLVHWDNFVQVFTLQPFARQFANSLFIMLGVCLLTATISCLAGYALSRTRLPGASIILLVILSGIFIPSETTIIPLYRLAVQLGWVDTPWPLIIFTSLGMSGAIGTFIMRQAYLSVPRDFEDCAFVDGASRWRTLVSIVLPLVRPSIAAVVVLSAWESWNQFLEPLIYERSADQMTVPVALAQYSNVYTGPLLNIQLAATTLSIVPVLAIFLVAQRQVIAGLTAGGIKG